MTNFNLKSGSLWCVLMVSLGAVQSATAQENPVIPLTDVLSGQSREVISGDPSVPGEPYVIRLHNDAGYVVLPHTHPEIENIVVVSGSWSLALGARYDPETLRSMEVGDYIKVLKRAPHYGQAKTEITIQIHGIGPFSTDYVDPVYVLNGQGIFTTNTAGQLGEEVTDSMSACFTFKVGDKVRGPTSAGTVVGAQCSPVSQYTQYWVQTPSGDRFWATASELTCVEQAA